MRTPVALSRWTILVLCIGSFAVVLGLATAALLRSRRAPSPSYAEPPPVVDAADDALGAQTPTEPDELAALQERIEKAVRATLPAVVSVQNPVEARESRLARHESGGSGVIISPDGLVLSQRHVSHIKRDEIARDPTASHLSGEKTRVILHDGSECEAELLGASRTHDLSLLRLIAPGPYPFVPLDASVGVRRGDWVLKLGHPIGHRRDRSAPVRLGRVLGRTAEGFYTDCPITGGDSGGPYFDLDGRLVGIVAPTIPALMPRLMSAPSDDPAASLRSGSFLYPGVACPVIDRQLGSMRAGEVLFNHAEYSRFERDLLKADRLSAAEWSQGRGTRSAFRSTIRSGRESVVAVLNGDAQVALGTVVGTDGWILSKASELPTRPRCRLPDGRIVEARVVGAEAAFDLALLKAEAVDLRPMTWADSCDPVVGALVAAPGQEDLPLAIGVVSVPRRELADANSVSYGLPLQVAGQPPEISGPEVFGQSDTSGKEGYLVHTSEGLAYSAGIREGDRVMTFDGRSVDTFDDLVEGVKNRMSGDLVRIVLLREGQTIELSLPLSAGNSYASFRRDDFPVVFEHSAPVFAYECGGPILDLSGRAVGITIARVERHGCLAIPGDVVQELLPALQSGELAVSPAWDQVPFSSDRDHAFDAPPGRIIAEPDPSASADGEGATGTPGP